MGRETGLQTLFSVFHWFEFNVEDCRLLKSALVSVDFGGVKEVKLFSVPRLYHVLPKCRMPSDAFKELVMPLPTCKVPSLDSCDGVSRIHLKTVHSTQTVPRMDLDVPNSNPFPLFSPLKIAVSDSFGVSRYTKFLTNPDFSLARLLQPGPCASGWPWPIWTIYRSGVPFAYDDTAPGPRSEN